MPEFTPAPGSPDPALVAADLRALAELIEGDVLLASMIAKLFEACIWPAHSVHYTEREGNERTIMAEAIRRFKTVATAPLRKEYQESGEGYLNVTVPLRALTIELTDLRERVCERIVTGVEIVPEEVPDPEYVAAAPKITVERKLEQGGAGMSTPDAFHQGLAQLLNAPMGSMDRNIGLSLAAFDRVDDNAGLLGFLITLYDEDPKGTRPFQVATDMMRRIHEAGA